MLKTSGKIEQNLDLKKKKYLFKKGMIKMSNRVIDKYKEYFSILDVFNQKMKLYNKKENEVYSINLKGFKIEESRDQEFVLTKADRHYNFQTVS